MEPDTRTDPDRELERSGDEFEERLEKVEGRIDKANAGAEDHRDHAAASTRGDDEDDDGDGADPTEFDDPDAEEEEEDE